MMENSVPLVALNVAVARNPDVIVKFSKHYHDKIDAAKRRMTQVWEKFRLAPKYAHLCDVFETIKHPEQLKELLDEVNPFFSIGYLAWEQYAEMTNNAVPAYDLDTSWSLEKERALLSADPGAIEWFNIPRAEVVTIAGKNAQKRIDETVETFTAKLTTVFKGAEYTLLSVETPTIPAPDYHALVAGHFTVLDKHYRVQWP